MSQTLSKKTGSIYLLFTRYVSQNILGMIGLSAYVLADTFFISQAEGSRGIAALNLVLPVYSLIFAIGAMIGSGSATRFKIHRARQEDCADLYFSNAVSFALLFSLLFMAVGICIPDKLVALLGGNEEIVEVGASYTRIFMSFAPFFMWNHIFNAFVRNDNAPSLAMAATLFSSLFNIVMDYILMFPLKMGMKGAALATAISPIVGILICSLHFLSEQNSIRFRIMRPSVHRLIHSCQLGVAAFVGEISSGVITMVFNFLILGLAGNIGVAAYGVVANTAIVATSVFNGVAQGSQPLLSDFYGKGNKKSIKKVFFLSTGTALVLSVLVLMFANLSAETITAIFNREQNEQMATYAVAGMKLYFIGYLFAGFNIIGTGFLSATEKATWAFVTSVLRGFVAIIVFAFFLSALFGMTGVWLAFPASECLTAVVMCVAIYRSPSF